MAGAEKLIYELVHFSHQNNLKVTVLIANNYNTEYYDPILKKMGVEVVRTTLQGIWKLRNPVNLIRALYWNIKLKYFAQRDFESVQVIGLYNVVKMFDAVKHTKRFFWHVENRVQYNENRFIYPEFIFNNAQDTIVFINEYQANELHSQYASIKCSTRDFKIFLSDI
ncbi:glycosyltransferase [Mucilaginibacter pallidiroseus]|uniref:Glycosyltransferase n=1 Tax=Mucilaginibacter pallidiroseus TaxID=2599295 RepID=A0A563U0M2_9SPHI|nr:glycosyltransferase [Mucilaginibacter pallidiroseus]TWR25178.1 glycosyltransferase [Mucilaginibacter pallidiroseus]